ncbi:IclR family transcriptional regulator [Acuticoccus sp. I52.16.1]|uniref:IclR family transcriptional regulator n=1 Tax=Acuticoccus sp. I52.16.1 TaxID=2928472 RepID=UPI001FD1A4AB|nr:IclR family transcriptional regulator [Acuticoccus sp. I52.16.1]UOM35277.1 IclR family transcriptional regulator [Acuticoccus sp. I52.16.1]
MAEDTVPAGETVGSIGRAVAAIRCVARGGAEGRRLSDVAREIGLHKATAARVLATLTETGVLRREDDRRYRIAPQFLEALGLPVSLGALRQRARGELMELVEKVEDTGLLSVRSGLESLCIDRHVGRHPLQALSLDVGARRPLGAGAGSLALLAFLPRDERETILAALADRLPYRSVTAEAIRHHAAEARRDGYTYLPDFVVHGMTGIGAPVREPSGLIVAAVSVAGVGDRLKGPRRDEVARLVLEACGRIEARLAGGA